MQLYVERLKMMDYSETIEIFDIKVGKYIVN